MPSSVSRDLDRTVFRGHIRVVAIMSVKLIVVIAALCAYNVSGDAGVSYNNKCEALLTAYPPKPESSCCGQEASPRNRILNGRHTDLGNFPWLALIEYAKEGKPIKTLCGGALISGRYVLTAAHCVTGIALSVGTPQSIRLGEYDTSNEGQDCQEVENGVKECDQGTVTIPIEKIIVHPEYQQSTRNKNNDIALIRLKQNAPFTDFIRPICLPTKDITLDPPSHLTLFEAGWGDMKTGKPHDTVKLFDMLPYVPLDKCQASYTNPGRKVTLWDGQLCADVEFKDKCTSGLAGGPLMHESNGQQEVVGVVSFGPKPCGSIPSVYTKVYKYDAWIKSVIN